MSWSEAKHLCLVSSSGHPPCKGQALFSSNTTNGFCTTIHIYLSSPCEHLVERACDGEYTRGMSDNQARGLLPISSGHLGERDACTCGPWGITKITGNIRFRVREPHLLTRILTHDEKYLENDRYSSQKSTEGHVTKPTHHTA